MRLEKGVREGAGPAGRELKAIRSPDSPGT